jgi:hypothetical protein
MMLLSPDEIAELTGKVRPAAQRAELLAMGIPFRLRRDGSVAVLRSAVQVALGHHEVVPQRHGRPQLRFPIREAAQS